MKLNSASDDVELDLLEEIKFDVTPYWLVKNVKVNFICQWNYHL